MLPRKQTTLRRRILLQSLLLTAFTVAVLSLLSVIVARSLLQNRVLAQLSSVVASRENDLSRALQYDRERTALLAARGDVLSLFASPSDATLRDIRSELLSANVPVMGIELLNTSAYVLSRAGASFPPAAVPPVGTTLMPVLNAQGRWIATDVYTPVHSSSGRKLGTLAVRYDPSSLLQSLSVNTAVGPSGTLLLLEKHVEGAPAIVYDSRENRNGTEALRGYARTADPALLEGQGTAKGRNEAGDPVLAAFRTIPATGWDMLATVTRDDALVGWQRFVVTMLAIDASLLTLSLLLALALSDSLIAPLLRLARNVSRLSPGHWEFRRSAHTKDEVELLDRVIDDLTSRLRATYDHLEEEISARTEDLRRQYLLDRAIVERIEYGVFVVDAEGVLRDINPAAAQMLQRARERMIGQPAVEVLRFFREGKPLNDASHPVSQAVHGLKRIHADRSQHLSVLCGDNTLLPVLLSAVPLLSGSRREGCVIILEDIRKETQIDEMKSEFITLASHQLRTPLSSLRWYLELLSGKEGGTLNKEQQSYVSQMDDASKRMAKMLDDLLHVSRLEGGEIRAEKKSFDASSFLRQIAEEWRPVFAKQALSYSLSLPAHPVSLSSDPVLLRLVLQNLLSNSLKYSPKKGQVHVELVTHPHAVCISVSDAGMGIPSEEQSHIFQKFFRAKNARSAGAEGSGLGLYLAKTIVGNLGGSISFRSERGKGTTFTIRLPRK